MKLQCCALPLPPLLLEEALASTTETPSVFKNLGVGFVVRMSSCAMSFSRIARPDSVTSCVVNPLGHQLKMVGPDAVLIDASPPPDVIPGEANRRTAYKKMVGECSIPPIKTKSTIAVDGMSKPEGTAIGATRIDTPPEKNGRITTAITVRTRTTLATCRTMWVGATDKLGKHLKPILSGVTRPGADTSRPLFVPAFYHQLRRF